MRFSNSSVIILLVLALLTLPGLVFGQSAPRGGEPAGDPKREESVATRKGFKTKIFEVKNRDPKTLAEVLNGLSSREGGSLFETNRELKTIIVRDYPEIVASIEDALNRLDQPEKAPINFDVQIHLIAASRATTEKSTFPAGLDPVVAQLQSTLKYGGYRYITTFLNRVKDEGTINGNGSTDLIFPLSGTTGKALYRYAIQNIKLIADTNGKEMIQVHNFRFDVRTPVAIEIGNGSTKFDYQDFDISTDLGVREGEMVVVGTANIGSSDEAIIVVISVKKAK